MDGHGAATLEPRDAAGVEPIGQMGLSCLGHQRAHLGAAHRQILGPRYGWPGAVPTVERFHGEVLRWRKFGHAVGARSDDRAHRTIGAERGRRQHLRAAMGEQRQQRGEGAREPDADGTGLCIDSRDGRVDQHPGGVAGAPEGGDHIGRRHRRAVMEARARPQREAPLQAVWR